MSLLSCLSVWSFCCIGMLFDRCVVVSLCNSVCLSLSACFCVSLGRVCVSVCLLCVCRCVCVSLYVRLSFCQSVCMSVSLSIYLCSFLCLCLVVCLWPDRVSRYMYDVGWHDGSRGMWMCRFLFCMVSLFVLIWCCIVWGMGLMLCLGHPIVSTLRHILLQI